MVIMGYWTWGKVGASKDTWKEHITLAVMKKLGNYLGKWLTQRKHKLRANPQVREGWWEGTWTVWGCLQGGGKLQTGLCLSSLHSCTAQQTLAGNCCYRHSEHCCRVSWNLLPLFSWTFLLPAGSLSLSYHSPQWFWTHRLQCGSWGEHQWRRTGAKGLR